MRKYEFVKSLK